MNCVWDVRYRTEPTGITRSPLTHVFLHVADTQHRQPQRVANFPLATTTNNKFSVANENPPEDISLRTASHVMSLPTPQACQNVRSLPFPFREAAKERRQKGPLGDVRVGLPMFAKALLRETCRTTVETKDNPS